MKILAALSTITLLTVYSPTLLSAATITDLGSTAPTPGTADLFYLPTSVISSNVYTNAISGTFGETFTTGSSAAAFTLNDVVIEVKHDYGNTFGNFSVPISIELNGVSLDTETASITGSTAFQNDSGADGHYLELDLSTPVALLANTQYSFNIGGQTTGAGGGTVLIAGGNATLTNASGFATGRTNGGDGPTSTNFVFDVGLTPAGVTVPEPQTWAMLLGGAGILLGMQRMRARK